MAIDKLIPQYLNKDEDARLIKGVEMSDALNVRVSHESDGDQGILKNVLGNTAITPNSDADAIPAGSGFDSINFTIGSVASEKGKCIYFFIWNLGGAHGIYQYKHTTNTYFKVYENSALNFNYLDFVKADVVINQFGEHLLYFTDNRNEPRKINATRALEGGYNANIDAAASAELFLTVCKQPPQTPPTFTFLNDETLKANNLKENIFQFTYQYVYDDGEVSALSMYSEAAVSQTHLYFSTTASTFLEDLNNAIDLTLVGSDGPVRKLRIFARKNNEGAFVRIGEIDNAGLDAPHVFRFLNDGVYTFAPDQEVNKLFDAVPRKAFTQAISNNRIFYGNYLEGFDNITTSVIPFPLYLPSFLAGQSNSNIDIAGGIALIVNFDSNATTTDAGAPIIPFESESVALGGQNIINYWHAWSGVTQNETAATIAGPNNDFNGQEIFNAQPNLVHTFEENTGGVHFDIDLSDIDLSNTAPGTISANVTLACSEFMIASHGASNQMQFETDLNIDFAGNGVIDISETVTYLDPDSARGNINNLWPSGNVTFNIQAPYDGSATTAQEFADILLAALVGQTAIVAVQSPSVSEFADSYPTVSNTHRYSGASTMVQTELPPGDYPSNIQDMNRMWLWLQGLLSFRIDSGTFIAGSDVVRCNVRMINASLYAWQGKADRNAASVLPESMYDNIFYPEDADELYGLPFEAGFVSPGAMFNNNAGVLGGYTQNVIYDASQIGIQLGFDQTNGFGQTLADNQNADAEITTYWRNYRVISGNVTIIQEGSEPLQSYKAGATHEFGIVYYDHRNRCSGVQPIDNVNVAHFGNAERFGNEGPTKIDLKILHDPPYWATKWAPVYTLNTTYESILQFAVAEAALGTTTQFDGGIYSDSTERITESLDDVLTSQIFLSMRPLEGKVNSYKELKGANKSYEYLEGDVLRVMQYRDATNAVQYPMHEFKITSYKFYSDDEKNPIKLSHDGQSINADEKAYRRTGWWLTIQDNNINGFTRNDVISSEDFFSQRCVVEIFRPKKSVEERVYYETGKVFDIVEVNGERTHAGDRSNSVANTFFPSALSPNSFVTSEKLFVGDRITTSLNSVFGFIVIAAVLPLGNDFFQYTVHEFTPLNNAQQGVTYQLSVDTTGPGSIFYGSVTLEQGDVYYRLREMLFNPTSLALDGGPNYGGIASQVSHYYDPTNIDVQEYDTVFIEDQSANDFFDAKAVDIGRPHIEMPDGGEVHRMSSVTYSEVTPADSLRNFYGSFNPSLFPFKDYNTSHGSICYLIDQNETLMVLQENKVVSTPVGRTLIQDAGGGQLVTSVDVLGTDTFYAGDYGPGMQPESVKTTLGKVYFADISSGVVVEISGKGLKAISSASMESYFSNKFSELSSLSQTLKIRGGYDPDNDEYILTVVDIHTSKVSVPAENGGTLSTVQKSTISTASQSNTTFSDGLVDVVYKKGGQNTWELCADRFQLDSSNWENSGNGVVFLDKLGEKGSAYVDTSYRASTSSISVKFMTGNEALIGYGSLSLKDNSIDIPSTVTKQSDGSSVTVTKTGTDNHVSAETIAYSTKNEFWLTFYSFRGDLYEHLHNRFFSFRLGQMYRHNVNETRNNFYGEQYNSTFTIVSRANPSDVKVYDAMSLESNSSWSAVVSNTEQTTGTMASTEFEEREGMYYRQIEKDATANSTNNTSHKVVLGQVASVDGSTITFTSKISNLPFGIGDTLYKLESSSETSLSVTLASVSGRKEVTASGTVSNLAVGDTVMAVSTASINGDKLRDYHAQVALTNTATTPVELFAVNMVYKSSPLHNNSSIPSQDKQ